MSTTQTLETFRKEVFSEIVLPSYKSDISDLRLERKFWERVSTASKVFAAVFTALTIFFISMDYRILSILFSSLSLSAQGFISTAGSQVRNKTIKLNDLISALGIKPLFQDISSDLSIQQTVHQQNMKSMTNLIESSKV